MDLRIELLRRLADGRFHSGEALARQAGLTRAAIWKQIKSLEHELGLRIESCTGKGYRLEQPLELLDAAQIVRHVPAVSRHKLSGIHLHHSIDSTNTWLMRQAAEGVDSGTVCLAERQFAGKGRHGRRWISPYGRNIYLSMLWRFPQAPVELAGMSLAAGIGVLRTLKQIDCVEAGLKWPNDILWRHRKLAGLLLEVAGESAGPSHLVIGVGLNLHLDASAGDIDQPWVDLASIPGIRKVSRNALVARLLGNLWDVTEEFERAGLAALGEEWNRYDLFKGSRVVVRNASRTCHGEHMGIDESGGIRVRVDGEIKTFWAGEVSLRSASGPDPRQS